MKLFRIMAYGISLGVGAFMVGNALDRELYFMVGLILCFASLAILIEVKD